MRTNRALILAMLAALVPEAKPQDLPRRRPWLAPRVTRLTRQQLRRGNYQQLFRQKEP